MITIDPNDEFLADWKLTTGTDFMDTIKAHLMKFECSVGDNVANTVSGSPILVKLFPVLINNEDGSEIFTIHRSHEIAK